MIFNLFNIEIFYYLEMSYNANFFNVIYRLNLVWILVLVLSSFDY